MHQSLSRQCHSTQKWQKKVSLYRLPSEGKLWECLSKEGPHVTYHVSDMCVLDMGLCK